MSKVNLFLLLVPLLLFDLSFAGDLQGGGGGSSNLSIRRYLDKRVYSLDGARKEVVRDIKLTNACIHGPKVHSIEPVWACAKFIGAEDKNEKHDFDCENKSKMQVARGFAMQQKVCEKGSAKIINGKLVNICNTYSKNKVRPFKRTYALDVYRRSAGSRGSHISPDKDNDEYLRRIKYKIPDCNELDID